MNIIKKLLRGLVSNLFNLFIFLVALVTAVVFTFHSPKKIEKSLSDSGVYSTFIDNALQEANKSNKDQSSNDIPISDPAIKTAANKAFTPELLQRNTENILDGTYDWLSGKTATPDFRVDLRSAKKTFAMDVGEAAKNRLASLTVCTPAQMRTLNSKFNPFNVSCRPQGINLTAQQQKVTHDLLNSKDFLGTPLLTAQNLPKNDKGQTVFEQLSKAPKIYRLVNASPWLLGGLAVVTSGVTLLLYDSKRRGLRFISITLISTGILLLVISFVSSWLLNKANQPGGRLGQAVKGSFQQTVNKAVSSINNSFQHIIIWIGAVYLLAGITTLLILHFTKPKNQSKDKVEKDEHPKLESKSEDEGKKATRPLVQ